MKNLKKLFVAFIAMVTTISCGDPELPVELFPEMQYGAYARKMSQEGKFNFYDIAGSSVDMHVEYYDCLLYTSPSPRDSMTSRMPSSA